MPCCLQVARLSLPATKSEPECPARALRECEVRHTPWHHALRTPVVRQAVYTLGENNRAFYRVRAQHIPLLRRGYWYGR